MSGVTGKVLSISIAAYNADKTLGKAVESLTADESVLDKLEIIIVNDGSSDKTGEIAHEFQSRYPGSVIVIDKENGGYGSTINSSLPVATGKYYKLLDGDDWFDNDVLPDFLKVLSDSDADLVISPYLEVRGEEKKLDDFHPEIPAQTVSFDSLGLRSLLFAMHEIAVNTEKLKAVSHKVTEHCFYTDTEYNVMCFLNAGTVSRFDRAVYCYRVDVNGQSMSLSGVRKHYQDLISVTHGVIGLYRMRHCGCTGKAEAVLERYVRHIIFATSCGLMVLEDPKAAKAGLLEYESMLKERYPEEYKISNGSGFLRIMRRMHYSPFSAARSYAMKKFY